VNTIALKMLLGDRAKYFGIVMGLTFASLLITQQAGIFVGLITRSYSQVTDTPQPQLWVMNEEVEFSEDMKRVLDKQLYRVRAAEGVEWAVPMFKGYFQARPEGGRMRAITLMGLDDATLIGGPPAMVEGRLEDLRQADAIVIDAAEAGDKLARVLPDGTKVALKVGDTLEINDRRAVVVGTCKISPTFWWQPTVYTTYTRATQFAIGERKLLSYVLVGLRPGADVAAVQERIKSTTGLVAYTPEQFKKLTADYVVNETGIAINFGIAVALGFIVGTAVAGQTFYNFTLDNLRHFGALKAMGASNGTLLRMIVLQALLVGAIGYGLGVGFATLFGHVAGSTKLAFLMPWQLLVVCAGAILTIVSLSALISARKVLTLEPAIVFKG
jgi:putative ABC transport system permease protein